MGTLQTLVRMPSKQSRTLFSAARMKNGPRKRAASAKTSAQRTNAGVPLATPFLGSFSAVETSGTWLQKKSPKLQQKDVVSWGKASVTFAVCRSEDERQLRQKTIFSP